MSPDSFSPWSTAFSRFLYPFQFHGTSVVSFPSPPPQPPLDSILPSVSFVVPPAGARFSWVGYCFLSLLSPVLPLELFLCTFYKRHVHSSPQALLAFPLLRLLRSVFISRSASPRFFPLRLNSFPLTDLLFFPLHAFPPFPFFSGALVFLV